MIRRMYERHLARQLVELPDRICVLLSDRDMMAAPERLGECVEWCREVGLRGVIFHISTADPANLEPILPAVRAIARVAHLTLHYGDQTESAGEGMEVTVAIGKSGREEIADCIRRMAEDGVDPSAVDEHTIESYLTFPYTPDLVIKTGGNHLTDFLIWQSVYSEFFFSDVNWPLFRRLDLLRALRDYQSRVRRFGR
ncbi:MAG TPA: undecaprenyl diphosphate synthase family protein [Methanoregulaceae archaeon]|nr:undecaprenyl diphosphate synthase family protein [Methanoregulaceae archaeon]HQJ87575.1 undecaprenyl diphosphate synthase family protein [Methanoregulaceae archaeon]